MPVQVNISPRPIQHDSEQNSSNFPTNVYNLFFIAYSLHSLSNLRKVLGNCFYGLLIFPVSEINLIVDIPRVSSDPQLAVVTIAQLLLAQFSAFNFLIFGKIKKPILKRFFIHTDKLINQIEAHSKKEMKFHNYFRRKSNFKFAIVAIFVLQFLLRIFMDYYDWGTSYTWVVFDISHAYYTLWFFGPTFIINCTCMEIYIKLFFVLQHNNCKYRENFYLICNQVFKNLDTFYTIFDTSTVIVLDNAFLDAIFFCFWFIEFGELSFENFLFLAVSVLAVFFFVQNGSYLFKGVSITIFKMPLPF